jgi:hypothetical protein
MNVSSVIGDMPDGNGVLFAIATMQPGFFLASEFALFLLSSRMMSIII